MTELGVTFLLSDIVGSTRLWEFEPVAMARAVAEHEAVIAAAVTEHGGRYVKHRGEGDATFSVFDDPAAAVAAALALQRELGRRPWPTETPVAVRVALHTGEAEGRDGDYFGPTVNRVARLRSLAQGGQVLLSATVAEQVLRSLPADASIVDLGWHQLKDIISAERVFQLAHPDITATFELIGATRTAPTNLPRAISSFVGRELELKEVTDALADGRLITLVGPGGVGKTRLATAVAASAGDHFPDGVWFVQLADERPGASIANAILAAAGAHGGDLDDLERDFATRHCLVVLDNCEHLLDEVADVVLRLLATSPACVIATSREPLEVPGERRIAVSPLAAGASSAPAVLLFVERAGAAGLRTTEADLDLIDQICDRLDGLPLAIELAAAAAPGLGLRALAEDLESQLPTLTRRDRQTSHRSLDALLQWSTDLLTPEQARCFDQLSVFVGGFSLEAAAAVCAASGDEARARAAIRALADKSLLSPMRGATDRWRQLETVRQFAAERLAAAGESEAAHAAHFDWFHARLIDGAARYVENPREVGAELDPDVANFSAAIDFGRAHEYRRALAMAIELEEFARGRSHLDLLNQIIELAEAAPPTTDPFVRACTFLLTHPGKRLYGVPPDELRERARDALDIARLLVAEGRLALATRAYAEASKLPLALKDRALMDEVLEGLPVALEIRDFEGAFALGGNASDLYDGAERLRRREAAVGFLARASGKAWWSNAIDYVDYYYTQIGRPEAALQLLEDFLATARASAETGVVVWILTALASAHFRRGDIDRGLARAEEAYDLALQAQAGRVNRGAAVVFAAGRAFLGDFEGAIALARLAYDDARRGAHRVLCAMTLFDLLQRAGRGDEAAALLPELTAPDSYLANYGAHLRALLACSRRDSGAAQAAMAEARLDDLSDDDASVHYGTVARVAALCGDREAALAAVDTLLRLDAEYPKVIARSEALDQRAIALASSGDPADADAARAALADADDIRERTGTVRCPIDEAAVADLRVRLEAS